ncbi:MAG: prepilin-type N-terminal cleavage/methylation domain-containing protein [Planctomycetota bacterium]|jgi:prepilin-type processing-associated H-X9-DG protein/prepilin-type N-terminal cleavage/methylation domain-containing protein
MLIQQKRVGFTLIELLVVVFIVSALIAFAVPSLTRARRQSKTTECLAHMRELSRGWLIYTDENDGVFPPHRMPKKAEGSKNLYDVGNGLKERPRWPSVIGFNLGMFAYDQPDPADGRQDVDSRIFQCAEEPNWIDNRNLGYGYNYQFLGNSRERASSDRAINFPVYQSSLRRPSGTVVFADSMGTGAAFAARSRKDYQNNGRDVEAIGNHGYTLDPPRLTDVSDRAGDNGERSAVDPRHGGKVNAVFADTHVETRTPQELGYRVAPASCFADATADETCLATEVIGTGARAIKPDLPGDMASNHLFSGNGRDADPPSAQ